MSKLPESSIQVLPTNDPNIFIRKLPLDCYRTLARQLQERGDGDIGVRSGWYILDEALCDKDGNRFEDYPSIEDANHIPVEQAEKFKRLWYDFVSVQEELTGQHILPRRTA